MVGENPLNNCLEVARTSQPSGWFFRWKQFAIPFEKAAEPDHRGDALPLILHLHSVAKVDDSPFGDMFGDDLRRADDRRFLGRAGVGEILASLVMQDFVVVEVKEIPRQGRLLSRARGDPTPSCANGSVNSR